MAALLGGDASAWKREHVLTECWGKGGTQEKGKKKDKAHPDIHAAVRSSEWGSTSLEHYDDAARKRVRARRTCSGDRACQPIP